MGLKRRISNDTYSSVGYGAGSGYIIQKEYECPCGNDKFFIGKRIFLGLKIAIIILIAKRAMKNVFL
ncbi:hypothetical protein [Bacillus atrophaeus]|uniref:hypothetical protein n=1 Tax=Bacillus atrophaeus TaxID=1452 RepID=UPI00077991C8|nr:hypothetical protein [Bacillus atrophaeus]